MWYFGHLLRLEFLTRRFLWRKYVFETKAPWCSLLEKRMRGHCRVSTLRHKRRGCALVTRVHWNVRMLPWIVDKDYVEGSIFVVEITDIQLWKKAYKREIVQTNHRNGFNLDHYGGMLSSLLWFLLAAISKGINYGPQNCSSLLSIYKLHFDKEISKQWTSHVTGHAHIMMQIDENSFPW